MSKKNKTLVLVLLLAVVLLAAVPFLTLKDAEFGGSDDAGSVMVEEIHGEYEPWFTPVLEDFLGKESRERWSPCCFVYRPESAWESSLFAWVVS
mgnify:FL=1